MEWNKNFDKENFFSASRHNKSDETFILADGSATLAVGEAESLVTVDLEKNKFYNVKKGAWHHIIIDEGAKVVIVENSDTGMANSEYHSVI